MHIIECAISSSLEGRKDKKKMRARKRGRAELAVFICLVALCFFSIPAAAQKRFQVLHKHVRPAVTNGQAARVGPMVKSQRMTLAIILPLRNQGELTNLLKRLNDPSSPNYRRFLTVAQFTERFAPTNQDYQAVAKFAKSKGFSVSDTPANRLLVHINGTVSQINKAFHVTMTTYRHPAENRTFYSPDREPSVDLSVPVAHVAGLNNFSLPRPKFRRAPANFRRNSIGSGPSGAYLGSDMRAAYYGGTALTGSGQAVGLLEFDGYNTSDVTASFAGQPIAFPFRTCCLTVPAPAQTAMMENKFWISCRRRPWLPE